MREHVRSRLGFTLVELLTVMIVIGVLASIAVLRYIDLTNEAIAGRVGNEMQQVRLAAIAYFSEAQAFPLSAAAGTRPLGLDPLLSNATQFTTPSYTLEWVSDGVEPDGLVGVVVRSLRPGLAAKLRQRLVYGNPYIPLGGDVMYIIRAPGVTM